MRVAALFGVAALVSGCLGIIGDGADENSTPPGLDGVACEGVCVGASGMMRLTRAEYTFSVRAVFGDGVVVDQDRLPQDLTAGPFDANDETTTEGSVTDYASVAWDIASQLAANVTADCTAETCAAHVMDTYAEELFRRPVTEAERTEYLALYDWALDADGAQGAVELMFATLLQSPHFIYRVERAADGSEPTLLTGLELAARMSFFLWSQGPDKALRDAAIAGELDTEEGIAAHVERLLADPKGQRAITTFHAQWLGIDEIDASTGTLADEMRDETTQFARDVFNDGGTLHDLFTSSQSVVGPELAAHYGVAAGDGVEVPGHVGILTHASVMTNFASASFTRPVHRGDMLLGRVLCFDLGTPPADALDKAEDKAAELSDSMTDREKLDAVTGEQPCKGCHSVLNPAGFAFESFDSQGLFRSDEAIDTSGSLPGVGEYENIEQLMPQLAASDAIADCLRQNWLGYALRRTPAADDETSAASLDTSGELRDILAAIVTTPAFRYRLPASD